MKEYYIHMFEYNDWANKLVLDKLKENPGLNLKISSLFSHIIVSQILWLNRIKKESYEFVDFWKMLTKEEMDTLNSRSTSDWTSFIKNNDEKELYLKYSYVNSRGIQYSNTLAQIMTHVINHSTYHRAQIASLLRAADVQPPLTDYIAFFR